MQQIIDFVLSDLIMVITPIIFGKLTLENKLRKDKSKFVVAFLISCILYGLSYLYLDGVVRTLCIFLFHIVLFYDIYNVTILKSIFISFLYCSIVMICDFLLLFTLTIFFNISKELCHDAIVGSLLSNVFVCFYVVIITILFRNKIIKIFNFDYFDKYFILLIIFGYISIVFLFFFFIFIYIIFFIFSFLFFFFFFYFSFVCL